MREKETSLLERPDPRRHQQACSCNRLFRATNRKFSFDFPVVADTNEQPDQRVILDLINTLVSKVAKGPMEPRVLTAQQLREVHARIKIGEPKEAIARAYNVDVAVIRQMAS